MKHKKPILLTFISLVLCGGIVLELIQKSINYIYIIKLAIFLFIVSIITGVLWGLYFATKGADRNVDSIDGKEIIYFHMVKELSFNSQKNTIEIKGLNQLKDKMNEVKILNINKISWNHAWIYKSIEENGLMLQGFSIKTLNKNDDNKREGSIIGKTFLKKRYNQKSKGEYNIYFEAGDILECNILAEEIVIDGQKLKLL